MTIALDATSRGPLVSGVRRIAVMRATALGDFVMILPALDALRAAYPEAEIVLLARDWHAALMRDRPGPVDRVVEIPEGAIGDETGDWDTPAIRDAFFASLADERFDLAVQVHGGGRNSNPFIERLGARVTAGTATPDARPLDRSVPYVYYQSDVLRCLEVVSLVGAAPVVLEPRLAVTPADLDEARPALDLLALTPGGGTGGGPLAVIHPGATDTRRRWPADQFAAVARDLATAGARVAVTGTATEADVVRSVVDGTGGGAVDLCGQLSLRGLIGLLSQASVVVSNDTGPRHLGAAVGAATVSVYWCGNLITAGPLTRSRHRPFISWRLDCPRCGVDCTRGSCEHRDSFVADVPIHEVSAAAVELLAADRPR